jgi:ketosteroid isomerase-like protein
MRKTILSVLLFSFVLSVPSRAQTLDAAARKEIGAAIAERLETMYVFPEKGKELAAQMRAAFASGKFDSATTPSALAEALNAELKKANDGHLYVRASDAGGSSPQPTMRMVRRMPGGPASDEDRRNNFGLRRVERLEGNIGYLDVGGFTSGEEARAAATAAMQFLEHTDAMIIDLRHCPGGSVDAVNYLASYFFGPEPRELMNRYDRPSNERTVSTTVDVPGTRFPEKGLFLLTSSRTGSACESFAFTLQQWGRGTVVGERSGGAGNNNALMPVGHGLTLSVSVGTATHPKSGKGWDAVGVQPDVAVPSDRARDAAHAAALQKLGRATLDGATQVRALEREWLDAYEARDSKAMNRIVADDFVILFPDGKSQTKADILAHLDRGRSSSRPAPKFHTEDVLARGYGDTVVLTGKVITTMQKKDGPPSTSTSLYTDTYVRRNGRWQVVASHLSNGS